MRQIARRIILFGISFASRRMFMIVIVVVRVHGTNRAQILMPAQMRTPSRTRHD
ncbi:hypothetical protein GRI47_04655 [Erythrobacter pelagi]|uniref:Uncharacterized protein n=1 Tax=Qipengyuania pelagi TaxID=994320 RepID=A0A844Y7C6_9SPHN|nr:hypothetical protein [Qipengyuania pelagi]MXO53297.1 hypothetical protein [Qipengyuania pelagi]